MLFCNNLLIEIINCFCFLLFITFFTKSYGYRFICLILFYYIQQFSSIKICRSVFSFSFSIKISFLSFQYRCFCIVPISSQNSCVGFYLLWMVGSTSVKTLYEISWYEGIPSFCFNCAFVYDCFLCTLLFSVFKELP